jgi:regulator of sirC expression with transglutaminase-like and TPR domain
MKWILFFCLLQVTSDPLYLETLYSKQDPLSLAKQLSFYIQYPDTKEGQRAKAQIEKLLNHSIQKEDLLLKIEPKVLQDLVSISYKIDPSPLKLNIKTEEFLKELSQDFSHSTLKGKKFTTLEELKNAKPEDIDVARGLLILSADDENKPLEDFGSYEAIIDFMALCVKARIKDLNDKPSVVNAINHFIFYELGYRFPAFSQHSEKIDTYTLLPSVLDNRQGVCLGVSLLYYSIAQRLGLDLTIYTPPGHIFLSLNEKVNIETTARGIHIPLKSYLSLHIKTVKKRNAKEMLGLALFNKASVFLKKEDFITAIALYEKALFFMEDDPLCLELLASCHLMNNEPKKAYPIFSKLKKIKDENRVSSDFIVEDFFKGYISPQALKCVFQEVDPTVTSLKRKIVELEEVLKNSPRFQSALNQLGVTYLQLHRYDKALEVFEKLYTLNPSDPAILYYLTELSLVRYDRPKTLFYKKELEKKIIELEYEPTAALSLIEEVEETWPSAY